MGNVGWGDLGGGVEAEAGEAGFGEVDGGDGGDVGEGEGVAADGGAEVEDVGGMSAAKREALCAATGAAVACSRASGVA